MAVRITDGALSWNATIDDSDLNRIADRMEQRFTKMSKRLENEGVAIESFAKKAAAAAAGYFSLQAAQNFIVSMAQVRGEFQQIEVAYRTMLKSKSAADRLLADSVKLAATTPFGLQDVASGSKQLLAFGFAAGDVTNSLRMLGNVAAGVGAPLNDIVYLYGTLRTQGRAYTRDIMQFTQRGIPIVDELANVLGKSKDQIQGLVEAGKIGFPEVEKAFQRLTGSSGMFFNLMQEQSRTITGLISNLSDAWAVMLNEMGRSNEGLFADGLRGAISLVENYEKVLEVLELLIMTYGAYRAALVLTTLSTSGMTAVELLHYGVLVAKEKLLALVSGKQAALAASTAAYTAVLTALAAITYSFIQYETAAEIAEESLTKSREAGARAAENEKERLEALISTIKDHSKSKEEQKAAYDELVSSTSGVLAKFKQEDIAAGKATQTLDAYIEKIKRAGSAENEYATYKGLQEKFIDLKAEGIKAVETLDKLRQSIANTFIPTSQGLTMKQWWQGLISGKAANDQIVNQEIQKVKDAQNKIIKGAFGADVQKRIEQEAKAANAKTTGLAGSRYDQFNSLITKGNVLTNFEELLKLAPDKAALDKLKETVNGAMEALSPGDKSISLYKAKIARIDALLKNYSASDAAKQAKKDSEDRLAFLENLNKLELESARRGMSKNQQQFQAIQDQYEAQRKEARKLNLGAGVITRIDRMEQNDTGALKYERETELFFKELDRQKELYRSYESYKTEVSLGEAKKRFSQELSEYNTYGDLLQAEINKIYSKVADGVTLTGPEQEKLNKLIELQKANGVEQRNLENTRYAEAYQAALTHIDQVRAIRKKYADYVKELGEKITDDQRQELVKRQDEEIKAANQTAFEKTELYKQLAKETVEYTQESLKAEIRAAEQLLKDSGLPASLRAEIEGHLAELNKALDLGVNTTNAAALEKRKRFLEQALVDPLIQGTEKAEEFKRELLDIQIKLNSMGSGSGRTADIFKGDASQVAANVSGAMGQLSGSFSELSSSLEGVNDDLAYTIGSIGELLKVGSDAAGAVSSFASGDFIGGISKTISAVAGLFNMGKKVKEMNAAARKEVADYYAQALAGEREYQALLRERERDNVRRGKTSYQALLAELELLKKQSPEVKKLYDQIFASLQGQEYVSGKDSKHGTWFRKAKTWDIMASLGGSDYARLEQLYSQGKLQDQAKLDFEALKELREELEAAGVDVENLQLQLSEMLTGTSVEGLSDALSGLFENGKLAAEDMGNTMESILRKAFVNSFKLNTIQKAMGPVFEMLSGMFENGKIPGEDEINGFLQTAVGVGQGLGAQWDVINQLLEKMGLNDLDEDKGGQLKGKLQRELTETTASEFLGVSRATFEKTAQVAATLIELLLISKTHLDKIVQNTGRTADNTDRLENIEDGIKKIVNNTTPKVTVTKTDADRGLGG